MSRKRRKEEGEEEKEERDDEGTPLLSTKKKNSNLGPDTIAAKTASPSSSNISVSEFHC